MVVHGEQMAVFASQVKVDGKPLAEMGLSDERWEEIKHHTVQGGSKHHQSSVAVLHSRAQLTTQSR